MAPQKSIRRRIASLADLLRSPAILTFAISGFAAIGSLLAAIILARLSGAEVVGYYALAASSSHLIAVLGTFGLDRIAMREVAGDLRQGYGGQARRTFDRISRFVLILSIAIGLAYIVIVQFTPAVELLGGDRQVMMTAAIGVIFAPLLRVGYATIRAADFRSIGQTFEGLPSILFSLSLLLVAVLGLSVSAGLAGLMFFTFQAMAAMGAWAFVKSISRSWKGPSNDTSLALSRVGVQIMAITFLQYLSEWLILAQVSSALSAADAGMFRVAYQAITIVFVLIVTAENYVSAAIAGDFRAGRADLAWRRWRRSTVFMMIMASPVLAVAIFLPGPVLTFVFGAQFEGAATALKILAIGQVFNVARGPIGAIMIMSGKDQVQLYLTIAGLAMLIPLALWLIPAYGLTGAAIAQAVPSVFRAIANVAIARRILPDRRTDLETS